MKAVHKELVLFNVDAKDAGDAIRQTGAPLFEHGYVHDTFIDAVVQREKEYPTGLQLRTMGVAMPHTFGTHVITPAVCVAKLAHPVEFGHMGESDVRVSAEILFMMAISDPKRQIETLSNMMGVFVNDKAMDEFANARGTQELFEVARRYIG